jgi:hypothetical protein
MMFSSSFLVELVSVFWVSFLLPRGIPASPFRRKETALIPVFVHLRAVQIDPNRLPFLMIRDINLPTSCLPQLDALDADLSL